MIQKWVFGKPIDTNSCVIPVSCSKKPVSFGTVTLSEKDTATGIFSFSYQMAPNDVVYGLGESVRGINKRGFTYISFCSDVPNQSESSASLYGSHNFLLVSGKQTFALYFDYPARIQFDIGYSQQDMLLVSADTADMALYEITADNNTTDSSESVLLNIVRQFRQLIGKSYIPPFWSFGYIQSRWGYKDEDDIQRVVEKYRSAHIPLDGVCLDIDYMDNYKDFTVSPERFPNFKQFVNEMKQNHVHLIPIIDAGVKVEKGYEVFDEGVQEKHFCRKADGTYFTGGVWPGRSLFPDFLNEDDRLWFGNQYKKLTDKGIDGFWNDMNEPALFYSDESLAHSFAELKKLEGTNLDIQSFFAFADISRSSFNNPSDYKLFYHEIKNSDGSITRVRHDTVHNLYGANMTRAAGEAFRSFSKNKRILLFSRASFIGAHRYGGIWTGDNESKWEHLLMGIKMMPSLNMCGFLYSGTDIGGFGGNTTRDLLLRWLAFGIFTPLMRNHAAAGTRNQECYQFEHTEDFASVIGLRYKLIPYLYSEYMKAALNDTMYFKPLSFEYPRDERALRIEDELLLGESMLIAPVHEQNATGRMVYLPQDMVLIRYRNNAIVEQKAISKGDHYIDVPLADVVFFIKKDKVIPFGTYNAQSTADVDYNAIELIGSAPKGTTYTLYHDDGISPTVSFDENCSVLSK